jgi:hypothetical protein
MTVVSTASAGPVNTKFELNLYGFVQGDVIFSDYNPANVADVLVQNIATDSRGDLNFTAQNTRLGLDIKVPAEYGWTVTGKIEGDFSNTPNTSNPTPRLRHGYVSVDRPSWGILAGQTWMVVAPQNPGMINSGVLGFAGNIWSRYPQVRLTARPRPFLVELAALKMTNDNNTALVHTLTEEPRYQARISWNGDLPFAPKSTIGVSGDIGKHGLNTDKVELSARSQTIAIDARLPINRVTLTGEFFWAQNASLLLASCGVAPTHRDSEIKSLGGFLNVNVKFTDRLWLNAGYGAERNERNQLVAGRVYRNEVAYGNLGYKLTSAVSLIGEYGNYRTHYHALHKRENNRYQFAVKFDF